MQLMMLVSQGVDEPLARRALGAVGPLGSLDDAMMWVFNSQQQQQDQIGGAAATSGGDGGVMADDADDGVEEEKSGPGIDFDGQRFDRKVDPYSDEQWPFEDERWAVGLLREVVRAVYPEEEDDKMDYPLFLPARRKSYITQPSSTSSSETTMALLSASSSLASSPPSRSPRTLRLLGIDKKSEDNATWKEVVLVKEWRALHVFNLVSHGRLVYRTQVYSSQSRLSLAALDPMLGDRKVRVLHQGCYG
jgi:hypothetical protein